MESLKKNHFDLLGLRRSFALDPAELDKAYRSLQQVVHPDRFANAGETQRRLALQMAGQVNEAYATLKDPARRAAYLCMLGGQDVALDSNTSMPGSFLMLQMAWREALDEVMDGASEGDTGPGVKDALAKIAAEARSKAAELELQLHAALDETQDFVLAAGLTRQLVFVDKFLQDSRLC